MTGRSVDRETPAGVVVPSAEDVATQVKPIRRPIRIGGRNFAAEPTQFTDKSRMFGKVSLRKDHEAGDTHLIPQERLQYIRMLHRFAILQGRIDILQKIQDALGEEIIKFNAAHPPVRGGEFFRLGVSVTEIPEVTSKPDLDRIRQAAGASFPKYGTEQVIAVFTVPEEPLPTGTTLTGQNIQDGLHAAAHSWGMDDETIETNVDISRKFNPTDKEELYRAVNAGVIPEDAVNATSKGKVKALPLPKEKVRKPRGKKAVSPQA